MKLYDLIFASDRVNRFKRHFIFWLAVYIYHWVRISFLFPQTLTTGTILTISSNALIWGVLTNMLISYSIIYYLVPRFFYTKKYGWFVLGLVLLLAVTILFSIANAFISPGMKTAIGFTKEHPFLFMRGTLIRIFGNPPLICAMLLSLKTFKRWHLKQKENEMLVRENANAELQLLKAQVHPHFLFNTLNNIYSFTLSKSAQAEELVEKLSDMLRYMITDCNVELVPLEKEIKMLGDYIGLEKVRYGDRLDLWVDINNTKNNLLIAPLVMIPFVENSFKHGTSMMRGKQWIQLSIKTEDNVLDFTLINSKPPAPVQNKNKTGIGLMNVKKRLALLYPGKHELTVTSNESIFSVRLTLQLQFANEAVLTNFINHQFIYS